MQIKLNIFVFHKINYGIFFSIKKIARLTIQTKFNNFIYISLSIRITYLKKQI